MSKLSELRASVVELRDEAVTLSELEDITPEQDARLDEIVADLEAREGEIGKLEARQAVLDRAALVEDQPELRAGISTAPQFKKATETDIDVRTAGIPEVRDAARKLLDEAKWADDDSREAVERALNKRTGNYDGDAVARRLVATESDAYRSAWFKSVTGNQYLTSAEGEALARAQSLSPATAGGLGVPVIIDPTILITNGTGLLGILSLARIESITNNEWKGVSAAHTSWSFDAEAAEVSDDSSEVAQPTVPAHMARGFIPYSIEIGQDYPGFATEMGRLLRSGYEDLLASKLAVGSGSDEPTGVFTGVDAVTTSRVAVTTAGSFGAPDIDKVWAALPEKFRDRASWFMSVDINNRLRAFSAGDNHNRFTVDQTAEGAYTVNGKRVVLSDYGPNFTGVVATTVRNVLVAGDFSNFLVAQRVGMSVEYIPHLFGTTNARPTGQRGWFAHARIGSGVVVPNGLRVLRNT